MTEATKDWILNAMFTFCAIALCLSFSVGAIAILVTCDGVEKAMAIPISLFALMTGVLAITRPWNT